MSDASAAPWVILWFAKDGGDKVVPLKEKGFFSMLKDSFS
jgi:hypothetical protein